MVVRFHTNQTNNNQTYIIKLRQVVKLWHSRDIDKNFGPGNNKTDRPFYLGWSLFITKKIILKWKPTSSRSSWYTKNGLCPEILVEISPLQKNIYIQIKESCSGLFNQCGNPRSRGLCAPVRLPFSHRSFGT